MKPTQAAHRGQYTVSQAAEALGVAAGTLRRWEEEGKLTVRRTLGGHRRYSAAQVHELLEQREQGTEESS